MFFIPPAHHKYVWVILVNDGFDVDPGCKNVYVFEHSFLRADNRYAHKKKLHLGGQTLTKHGIYYSAL